MKYKILFLVLGIFMLLLSLFFTGPTDARLTSQVTFTPTAFNYLPFVAKNWPLPPSLGWCDDFNDGIIDETKWLAPTDENLIYEQDGVLNFVVGQSHSESVWASIEGILAAGRRVSEILFTITLESYEGDVSGAAGVDAYLDDGRLLSVDAGPGPDGPGVEFSICPTPEADYEDCDHPDGPDVTTGIPMSMRMNWSGENMDFYIDGPRYHREPASEPITEVDFYLYADQGSIFHATVDDVCVIYK